MHVFRAKWVLCVSLGLHVWNILKVILELAEKCQMSDKVTNPMFSREVIVIQQGR